MSKDNKNLDSQRPSDSGSGGGGRHERKRGRAGLLFFILIVLVFLILFFPGGGKRQGIEFSYTEFLSRVEQNQIESVDISGQERIRGVLRGVYNEDGYFYTQIPYADPDLLSLLEEHNVRVRGVPREVSPIALIFQLLPTILFIIILVLMLRQVKGNNTAFQFGSSRARKYEGKKKVTFADVVGQKEAKNELEEVVDFLKNPEKYVKMGARIPKGVLLVGMPGTGKTLMARAVAGEAGVAYFSISGSDFVEMFVGVGASRVRDLFDQTRKNSPCIIFIDELDAVGRTRGLGYGGGHDEREQTLNQMLVEMDGFDTKDGIIVLAATNRPDVLDPALLRPGRFDRQVTVAMPDIKEREDILKIHAARIPLGSDVDLKHFARATPGMSGADLANLVNEAALAAAVKNKEKVGEADFEEARDKILMGVARKSVVLPESERRMTAVHESGHALLHFYLEHADPLHKVTIVPRGQALGVAFSLPEQDSYSRTRSWILDRICICYGGFAAETIVYGETTTGTKGDIDQATEMARKMVCQFGMASDVGAVSYGAQDEPIFIGKEIARHKDYSEETAKSIDEAIKKILDGERERAGRILEEHRDELDALARELLEKETLDNAEIRALLNLPLQQKEEEENDAKGIE